MTGSWMLPPLIIALLSALSLGGCGGFNKIIGKKKSKKSTSPSRYFIKGDPGNIYRGASLNDTPILNLADIEGGRLGRYDKPFHRTFESQTLRTKPLTMDEIREQNSTEESDDESTNVTPPIFRFSECQNDECDVVFSTNESKDSLELRFKADDSGKLHLSAIVSGNRVSDSSFFKVIHYSAKPDLSALGFIVEASDAERGVHYVDIQVRLSVDMDYSILPRDINPDFDYIYGGGVRVYWPDQFTVDVCDPDSEDRNRLEAGIRAWQTSPGRINGIKLNVNRHSKKIPPIGDVNFNCAVKIEEYLAGSNNRNVSLGVTYAFASSAHLFERADMLIFGTPHQNSPSPSEELNGTIVHEFGHFLGLGHEFTEYSPGKAVHDSVMGYYGVNEITDWDRLVLKSLYKDRSQVGVVEATSTVCKGYRSDAEKFAFVSDLLWVGSRSLEKDKFDCEKVVSSTFAKPKVDLSRYSLSSLRGIEYFEYVTELELGSQFSLRDLTPLTNLPKLETLDLSLISKPEACPTDNGPTALRKFCEEASKL